MSDVETAVKSQEPASFSGSSRNVLFPDLVRYCSFLVRNRILIVIGAILGGMAAVAYAFLAKPVYRSEVVITSTGALEQSAGGRLARQFSGLAALAGIGGQSGDDAEKAFAVLSSQELIDTFIERKKILPELFAERWDSSRNAWAKSDGGQPTRWEAIKKFEKDVRRIARDTRTGVITVAMEWTDPKLAADWANGYVAVANELLRQQAIDDATATLEALYKQTDASHPLEVKDALYGLIEAQMGKLTVAQARPEYAFSVVDRALPPDDHAFVRPRRLALGILGIAIGAVLGLISAMAREVARVLR